MTSEATEGQVPDVYGQVHPIETTELIQSKHKEFEAELNKLPKDKIVNLIKAKEKCPHLLTDDFKLMFLRCEVFNADVRVLPKRKSEKLLLLFLLLFSFSYMLYCFNIF